MLTTITAILGLLPMVFRVNIDFVTREVTYGAPSTQWWTQLSAGIVFGLAFATVLTLIVTPCALMARQTVPERMRAGIARVKRWLGQDSGRRPPPRQTPNEPPKRAEAAE